MSNLLDKASIILTPTAYNNGEALCVKPSDGSGDFDFSRNSAATRVNAQGLVENVQILSSNLVQNGDFSEEGVQEVSNGSFSQEGVEEITNGSFDTDSDWSKSGSVTIGNGKANFDIVSGGFTRISQNISLTNGKTYKINLEVNTQDAGNQIFIRDTSSGDLGGLQQLINLVDGVTSYTYYFTANANSNAVYIKRQTASGDYSFSIDNVSVREVAQNWDLGTGWSIGEDKAVANTTGNFVNLYQNSVFVVGKTYKTTFTIVDYTQGKVRLTQGGVDVSGYQNAVGTYTTYFTASQTALYMQGSDSFIGSITNISVKEVGMDWTLNDWSIGEDKVVADGTTNNAISQTTVSSVVGKSYKIDFTIDDYVTGNIRIYFGGAFTPFVNANGVYSFYITAAYSENILTTGAYGLFNGSITNISVIEISTDTNLPRISYENFSYQDALGSELVVNGTFDDGTNNWTQQLNVNFSVDNGVATIQSTGSNSLIYQYISPSSVSAILKIEFDVVSFSGSYFYISLGGYSTLITQTGKVVIYTTSNRNSNKFDIAPQTTTTVKLNNVSVKEYLGQEVVPNSGCGSWLFEPQSTNLLTYSESTNNFSNLGRLNCSYSLGNGYDGFNSSCKITNNTFTNNKVNAVIIFNSVIGESNFFTLRVKKKQGWYLSAGSGNACNPFNLKINLSPNGGFISSSGTSATNYVVQEFSNYYLIGFLTTQNNTTTAGLFNLGFYNNVNFNNYDLTTIEEFNVTGIQWENNQDYATSYIPTSGSTVTRNQDVCTNGGSLATINSTEGTLYAEIAALANDGTNRPIALSDGSTSNVVRFYYSTTDNRIVGNIKSGGTTFFNFNNVLSSATDFLKVAISYRLNEFKMYVNGTLVFTDTSGNTPIGLNELAFDNGAGNDNFFGKTKCVAIWKEALSDSELQSLTTI